MQLSTQENQFRFELPSDFITEKIEKKWMPYMKKNQVVYSTVADYVNSTIQGITFPTMSIDSSKQIKKLGKKINWYPTTNIYDLNTLDTDITFKSVDSNVNYLIIREAILDNYTRVNKSYIDPFCVTMIDRYQDIIARIEYRSIHIRSLSEIPFSFLSIGVDNLTFTMQITYNYLDVFSLTDDSMNLLDRPDIGVFLEDVPE